MVAAAVAAMAAVAAIWLLARPEPLERVREVRPEWPAVAHVMNGRLWLVHRVASPEGRWSVESLCAPLVGGKPVSARADAPADVWIRQVASAGDGLWFPYASEKGGAGGAAARRGYGPGGILMLHAAGGEARTVVACDRVAADRGGSSLALSGGCAWWVEVGKEKPRRLRLVRTRLSDGARTEVPCALVGRPELAPTADGVAWRAHAPKPGLPPPDLLLASNNDGRLRRLVAYAGEGMPVALGERYFWFERGNDATRRLMSEAREGGGRREDAVLPAEQGAAAPTSLQAAGRSLCYLVVDPAGAASLWRFVPDAGRPPSPVCALPDESQGGRLSIDGGSAYIVTLRMPRATATPANASASNVPVYTVWRVPLPA